jgi:uncharacterized protein (TIGR03435 family)
MFMQKKLSLFSGMLSCAVFTWAFSQTMPRFDVATIKPVDSSAPQRGRLTSVQIVTQPGRLTIRNAFLREIIAGAYGLEDYQVSGGPAWIASDRFDVEGKAEGVEQRSKLLSMLQTLVVERFNLATHRETKKTPAYVLVLDKNDPKFRSLKPDETGCYPLCSGPLPTNSMRFKDVTSLAKFLTRQGSSPVVDKTGLQGNFDIGLDMGKIMMIAAQNGTPPTNTAIFEAAAEVIPGELGLKLQAMTIPLEMIVVDKVQRPSPN